MTSDGTRPHHVFEIYIKCTPQQLWEAITEARHTQRYFHGTSIESTWARGAPVVYRDRRGVAVQGEVREATPPRRLVTTWEVKYDPERAAEQPSELCWELEPVGDAGDTTRLTLTHLFAEESKTYREVGSGWAAILSSLKTMLETGEPLSVAS